MLSTKKSKSQGRGRYVPGEGPEHCDLAFVGEAPGVEEDRVGRPFIGKTGRELERYLRRALHLDRSEVYLTNLVKRLPKDGKITDALIRQYAPELVRELDSLSPRVVVCLGRHASRFFLGDVDMETVHGMAVEKEGRVYFAAYHPAAGLHNTEIQGLVAWDFERLRMLLEGELQPGVMEDEYPNPDYGCLGEQQYSVMYGKIAVDTEGSVSNPWGLSWSTVPGHAAVVRANVDYKMVKAFVGRVIFHNSLYDLGVLRAMGIEIADDQFDDTMIMSYLLCLESQGLKPLAKRHCGMEMHSYAEITRDASYKKAVDYLWKVWELLNEANATA